MLYVCSPRGCYVFFINYPPVLKASWQCPVCKNLTSRSKYIFLGKMWCKSLGILASTVPQPSFALVQASHFKLWHCYHHRRQKNLHRSQRWSEKKFSRHPHYLQSDDPPAPSPRFRPIIYPDRIFPSSSSSSSSSSSLSHSISSHPTDDIFSVIRDNVSQKIKL